MMRSVPLDWLVDAGHSGANIVFGTNRDGIVVARSIRIGKMFDWAADDFLELLFAARYFGLLLRLRASIEIAVRNSVRAECNERFAGQSFQFRPSQTTIERSSLLRSAGQLPQLIKHFPLLGGRNRTECGVQVAENLLARAPGAGGEHIPISINLRIRTHVPFATASFDCQLHRPRQLFSSENEPLEVVPPEFAIQPNITSRDVDRCRNLGSPQNGQSVFQIIEVTVIECDDHSTSGQSSALEAETQFIKGERVRNPLHDLKLLPKMIGTDCEKMRIRFRLKNSVITKNYRRRRNRESQSPPGAAKRTAGGPDPMAHD